MQLIAVRNAMFPLEYHFAEVEINCRLCSSPDPSVDIMVNLSFSMSSKCFSNAFQDSRIPSSLYFRVFSEMTQNVADNQINNIPAIANHELSKFQAFATNPSNTPFAVSSMDAFVSISRLSFHMSENLRQARSSMMSDDFMKYSQNCDFINNGLNEEPIFREDVSL